MSQAAAVLFVNEAFYAAFRDRDFATLEALWARRAPVACIHPGWQALDDREEIMESWEAILGNPDSPRIQCRNAEAFVLGESAFVICYEVLGEAVLVATNVFVREEGSWKLVHHQAGPCNAPPGLEDEEAEPGAGSLQ
jgi:ketosteroid isomerase-like protein